MRRPATVRARGRASPALAALLAAASAAVAAAPTTFLRHFRIGMNAQEAASALPGCAREPLQGIPLGCDKETGRCPRGVRVWCPLPAEAGKAPVAPGAALWVAEDAGLLMATLEFQGPPAEVFAKLEGIAGKLARKYGKWSEAGASVTTETGERGRFYRWSLWDASVLAEARRVEGAPEAPARGRVVFLRKGLEFPGWGAPPAAAPPARTPGAP